MPPSAKPQSSRRRSPENHSSKSLTPQRKHRKLLKDGSSEVWPESIEQVFVEGLRQYWESPWATYSRGRSRWRNQFLVDYLHKNGIDRSKKQVASHIQVLRNMWKGESEFHLVAGGEELYLETGSLTPVKSEQPCDTNGLIPLDYDESESLSPVSPSTPGLSPGDFFAGNRLSVGSPPPPLTPPAFDTGLYPDVAYPSDTAVSPLSTYIDDDAFIPSFVDYTSKTLPTTTHDSTYDAHYPQPLYNRVCFVSLWADGMIPFTVPADTRSPSPLSLRIKLHLSSIDDVSCPPTLHGFQGTVSLASPWLSSAQCITKVFASNACISEETGNLQLVTASPPASGGYQIVQAFLPESPLSRSRWLDANLETSISQQIIVDGTLLATIIYDLDRKDRSGAPSAQLVSTSRYSNPDPVLPFISQPSLHYPRYSTSPQIPLISRRLTDPPSISPSALIPDSNNFRPTMNTSMLF